MHQTRAHLRRWRRELLDNGVSEASLAKAYRLMEAIMNTAVDDGIVFRNPCRVRGAAKDRSPERSVLTVRAVGSLVEAIPERYRRWCSWRSSAVCAGVSLRRSGGAMLT